MSENDKSVAVVGKVSELPAKPMQREETALAKSVDRAVQQFQEQTSRAIQDVGSPFYGASLLKISKAEQESLAKVPDDTDILILPDSGEPYLPHEYYRKLLFDTFGAGQFSFISESDEPKTFRDGEHVKLVVKLRLYVRGHFVGNGTGQASYYTNNVRSGYDKTLESAESIATHRCMKKFGGGFLVLWNKKFCLDWKKRMCIQVIVQTQKGQKPYWRRRIDEPFAGESGVAYDPLAVKSNGDQQKVSSAKPEIEKPKAQTKAKPTNQTENHPTPFGLSSTHWKNLLDIASKYGITEPTLREELSPRLGALPEQVTKTYQEALAFVEKTCKELTADVPTKPKKATQASLL